MTLQAQWQSWRSIVLKEFTRNGLGKSLWLACALGLWVPRRRKISGSEMIVDSEPVTKVFPFGFLSPQATTENKNRMGKTIKRQITSFVSVSRMRHAIFVISLVFSLSSVALAEKKLTINSDPSGARVEINGNYWRHPAHLQGQRLRC